MQCYEDKTISQVRGDQMIIHSFLLSLIMAICIAQDLNLAPNSSGFIHNVGLLIFLET